ncbi:MAG: hypothetical protein KatS3mg105_2614 [Gemmatales bacterium]|nr:MAG: hypothetical protein KatS3mg105_2614 [Gemmatales bacterium]
MWRKAPLLCGFFLVSNLASPASEVVGYLGRAQPCFWRPGENRLVLAHAPNKPLLAIGGKTADGPIEKPIEIVNTESARIIQRCRAGDGYLTSVAFSGDGTLLFSGTENGTVHIWNVAKGSQIAKLEFHSWITALAAGSDNNLLAVGDKTGRVHMIDLSTKTIVGKRKAHKGAVHALEFTPDASILATAGNDGTVRFYRSKPFKLVRHFLAHRGRVASIAFSPDGKQLASGGKDNKLNMWQVNSGELLCALEEGGEVRNIIWLSKNKRIICSVGNHTLAFICMIKEVKKITHIFSDHINSIAVSHNEERLAVASPQRIQLYHLQQLINNSGHLSEICSISFSPSTRRLASADETGRICVWDIESRTQMCTFQDADFDTDVAFVSEQVLAFVSASKGVCLRNIENGKEVATFASCTAVTDFELSTDKRFMAIAVSKGPRLGDGSQFQIWDVDKKRKLSHFDVPTATYSFCFSPCDQAKVFVEEVAESSTTLAVYDALAGKRISQVRLNEHYERLAYLTGARTAVAVRAHSEPGMYSLGFYNLSDARLVRSSEVFHALGIECLSCSDDGRFVLVFDSHRCETNNGRILVFECASGKLVHTLDHAIVLGSYSGIDRHAPCGSGRGLPD